MDALMHRLSSMDDRQRAQVSWTLMALGLGALIVGVFFAHAGLAPDGSAPGEEQFLGYLEWVPRHWTIFTAGQLVAFGGSQFMLAGAALLWVANQRLTWARAGLAAWLAWIELVLLWGVVPSEWLNLTQGPLGWTSQKIFVTVPPWVVLNNQIDISYAVVKDAIAGGYHIASLAVVLWFAFKIQEWGKTAPKQDAAAMESPYGRPMRKVD